MGNWNENELRRKQKAGKIRGYKIQKRKKKQPGNCIPNPKPTAIIWLEWNLQYWANNNALNLVREHPFHPTRGWRFDFCFPAVKIAVEFEGGIYMQKSGHSSTAGQHRDITKYTEAQLLGWTVVRVSVINYTTVLETLTKLLKKRKHE